MTSNSKIIDLARSRFNSLSLKDVVQNNISLQSTERTLIKEFNISPNNVSADYFLGDNFKQKFIGFTEEKKTKFCRLLGGMRSKELQKELCQ